MKNYVVTALEAQKNTKKRYNLYLDGEFRCVLTEETVFFHGVKVGQTYTEEELQQIFNSMEVEIALNKSLNLLSKSMKTSKQIRDYLTEKGFDKCVIKVVLDKLEKYGYVNDSEYVKAYIAQNKQTKGKYRIREELILKGVSQQLIEYALSCLDEDEAFNVAFCLANKFVKDKPIDQKMLVRLNRHLLSRGFDFSIAHSVISQLKNNRSEYEESVDLDFDV